MLQIKTIMHNSPSTFDEYVNSAILDGWQLVKRHYAPNTSFYFCAELEREVVAPHEHNCSTCLYYEQNGGEPCDSCDVETWDKWEPQEGAIVMVPLYKREEGTP